MFDLISQLVEFIVRFGLSIHRKYQPATETSCDE